MHERGRGKSMNFEGENLMKLLIEGERRKKIAAFVN
jgi:hypothetical protein